MGKRREKMGDIFPRHQSVGIQELCSSAWRIKKIQSGSKFYYCSKEARRAGWITLLLDK